MKQKFFSTSACLLLAGGWCGFDSLAADVTQPIILVPAKNLDAFYPFTKDHGVNNDPKSVFTLTNGLLHITGEEQGYLATKAAHASYRLIAEYKWGALPAGQTERDSGVFIHGQGPDRFFMASTECTLYSGSNWVSGQVGPVAPNSVKNRENPIGEWNTLEILSEGKRLQVKLNGHVVTEQTNAVRQSGKVLLQSRWGEVFFRRLELLPLDKTSAASASEINAAPESEFAPIFNGHDFYGWKVDTNYWSVKDGMVDFYLDGSKGEAKYSSITYTNEQAQNFELRLRCRFVGPVEAFRGVLQLGMGPGYFTEVHANPATYGAIFLSSPPYPMLAKPSQRRTILAGQPREAAPVEERVNPVSTVVKSFKQEAWNDVVLVVNGSHVTVTINGIMTAELFDENRDSGKAGPVGFMSGRRDSAQILHAQFKDIRCKPLAPTSSTADGDKSPSASGTRNKPAAAERLKQLKELYEQKLITKEDYDKKVKEIMDSL